MSYSVPLSCDHRSTAILPFPFSLIQHLLCCESASQCYFWMLLLPPRTMSDRFVVLLSSTKQFPPLAAFCRKHRTLVRLGFPTP